METTEIERLKAALLTLREACLAMADPEHCLHDNAVRLSRDGWKALVKRADKALAAPKRDPADVYIDEHFGQAKRNGENMALGG